MRIEMESSGFLVGVTVAGIALLISGVVADNNLVTAIGGAILGASIGGWVSNNDIIRIENRVLSALSNTVTSRFTSNEEKAANIRKQWHLYHVTEMNKNKIWRHHLIDFGTTSAVGGLHSKSTTKDKNNDDATYIIEGGLRDQRLIMFEKAQGSDEPISVFIFPLFGESCLAAQHGIATIKTWDGDNALVPAIISRNPLYGANSFVTVSDDESRKLDETWKEEFHRLHKVFPRIYA